MSRIQRTTVEQAAEVNTLHSEVAAAARANGGVLIKAQSARDAQALGAERVAARQEERQLVRGGYALIG